MNGVRGFNGSTLGGKDAKLFLRTHRTPGINLTVSLFLSVLLVAAADLWARVTTPDQARLAVAGWLTENVEPFDMQLGAKVATVETFAGSDQAVSTRGGNGSGGPYPWDDMVLSPNCGTAAIQRQAIGALCFDAGASVHMEYGAKVSSADACAMADGLKTTFGFSNAVNGASGGKNIANTPAGLSRAPWSGRDSRPLSTEQPPTPKASMLWPGFLPPPRSPSRSRSPA